MDTIVAQDIINSPSRLRTLLPWHLLYSNWLWVTFWISYALDTPLTPVSSLVALVFGGVALYVHKAQLDFLFAMLAIKACTCLAYAMLFPQLRRRSYWSTLAAYTSDAAVALLYGAWLLVQREGVHSIYLHKLPISVAGKGARALLRARGRGAIVVAMVAVVVAWVKRRF